MRFAFLIHPISSEVSDLVQLEFKTGVLSSWGTDSLGLLRKVHGPVAAQQFASTERETAPVVMDEFVGPTIATGEQIRGQLKRINESRGGFH